MQNEVNQIQDTGQYAVGGISWVYVPTDFDTKEKALSVAKAAEKGLK